jgi:hypothetical protein
MPSKEVDRHTSDNRPYYPLMSEKEYNRLKDNQTLFKLFPSFVGNYRFDILGDTIKCKRYYSS